MAMASRETSAAAAVPSGPGTGISERILFHVLIFDDPEKTLAAVRSLRDRGFDVSDVHSPFPVHGMDEALGLAPTRISRATLIGGITGVVVAGTFQVWSHTRDWPLLIGGKSNLAIPALVPVGFELTILFAAFATVAALLFRSRLFPRLSGTPESQPDLRTTDDRFAVVVREGDAGFALDRFRELCRELEPEAVRMGWRSC